MNAPTLTARPQIGPAPSRPAGPDIIELDFTEAGALPAALLRRLDALADGLREPFNAMMATVSESRGRDIDWWVSRPASRNIHVSPLFQQCAQLALVHGLIETGARPRVRVDCQAMAAVLRTMGPVVDVVLTSRWRLRLKGIARHMWNLGSCAFHSFAAWASLRLTRRSRRALPAQPLLVIETFVTRDSVLDDWFRDGYFPDVQAELSEDERNRLYYLPILYRVRNYLGICRALRRAGNFLFYEDHLGLSDYAFACGHWWRLQRLLGHDARFEGFNVGPLIDADLRAGRFAHSTFRALLMYRFWRDAARHGIRVGRLIDWYEGNDTDHAIAAAINWHSTDTLLVGFRTLASHLHLSVTPAPHEVAAGVVPRILAVVGASIRREIQAMHPTLQVLPAPGFRYARLPHLRSRPITTERCVLVVLPIYAAHLEITRQMIEPARSLGVRWVIKRHPGMPRAEVETVFGTSRGPGFELVEGDLYDWFGRASVVVGVATNTLVEAVAAGIPVLCLAGGNRFTEIPIPSWVDHRLWRVCYDPQEMRDTLEEFLAAGPAPVDLAHLQDELLSSGGHDSARPLVVGEAA